jgi:hypothetical protein
MTLVLDPVYSMPGSFYMEIEMNEVENRIEKIIKLLSDMDWEEREEAMEKIRESFCIDCGNPHRPGNICQCWNDE